MANMDIQTAIQAAALGKTVVCDAADYHAGIRMRLLNLLNRAQMRNMEETANHIRSEVQRLDELFGKPSGGIQGVQIPGVR